MKIKVFNREDFKEALNLLPEPRFIFRGIRTRSSVTGPEIAFYVQAVAKDRDTIIEYEETISEPGKELGEEEYSKKLDDFNNWVFSLPAQKFLEGVVE